MKDNKNLFSDFPILTKKVSLDKLRVDLRGKIYEDLQWSLGDDIRLDPVFFREDLPEHLDLPRRRSNDWLVGEDISGKDAKECNKTLLGALTNGVNSPGIKADHIPPEMISVVFEGVETAFIKPFITGSVNNLMLFTKEFSTFHASNGKETSGLQGAICLNYNKNNDSVGFREGIARVRKHFPLYKFIKIGNDQPDQDDPVKSLSSLTRNAIACMDNAPDEKLSLKDLSKGIVFSVNIGKQYFAEITRLRALQLLWGNVQQSFGIEKPEPAFIDAHLDPESQGDDLYSNMISATTQAMSAVIGGCSRLTILPSDTKNGQSSDFPRRIARNIQHILKMESFLDKVSDPAAGSYFMDKLTIELAERVWSDI